MRIIITESKLKVLVDKTLTDVLELREWYGKQHGEVLLGTGNTPYLYYNPSIQRVMVFRRLINDLKRELGIDEGVVSKIIPHILEWFNENNPYGVKSNKIDYVGSAESLKETRAEDIIDRLLDKINKSGMDSLDAEEESYLKSKGSTKIPVVDLTNQEINEFFSGEFGELQLEHKTSNGNNLFFLVNKDNEDVITIRRTIVIIEDVDGNVCTRFGSEEGKQRLIGYFNDFLSALFENSEDDWEQIDKIMIDNCYFDDINLNY